MLRKGENAALDGGRVRVAVTAAGTPIDVSAVLLGDDRRVRSDDDLVFFNHPAQDGVRLEGAEAVIDPDGMPDDVSTIALVASVDGPGTFDGVALRADVDGGPRFEAPAMSAGETVAIVVEVYRRAGAWKLRAVGQGWASGLAGLATDFGVDVTGEPPVEADLPERISLRKETVRGTTGFTNYGDEQLNKISKITETGQGDTTFVHDADGNRLVRRARELYQLITTPNDHELAA